MAVGLYDSLNFVSFRDRKFTEGDAFIGYQKDTPAAVVFQATHQLEREGPLVGERTESVGVLGPRAEEEEETSHVWKENVSSLSHVLASVVVVVVVVVVV